MNLANNSIGKFNENQDVLFSGNMMSEDNLVEYIETVMKMNASEAMGNIKKQMDTIITTSLKVTGENVKAKKGCFVSLGFDFMLD